MKQLSEEHVSLIANRARALGDATRVRILYVLARGEQPVGSIASAIEAQQSTVSKHLQVLFHAGLVARRRVASAVIYSLASDELIEWCDYLGQRQLSGGERVGSR
jgi:DNA-binding transcriptional ArsR family regulator